MKKKKIAIVTGASSGMGREMVYQLAASYAGLEEIWIAARRKERLEELSGRVPVKLRAFALDLTRPEDRKDLLEALSRARETEHIEVRILVNAAGFGKTGAVGTIPEAESTGMVRLNDEALVAVTELVLPFMPDHSRIIQFASAAAFLPQPGFAVYAATKAFVLSYSRALNRELSARDIAVTAVCPGPVETEFFNIALNGGSLTSYKKWVTVKPEYVVARALRDSAMGREISVAGPVMRAFFLICKVLPHGLLMRLIRW